LTHIGYSEKVLCMRIFLLVVLLSFNLQSWTKADDVRDFQIEGMSIGDSALIYFNKAELIKRKEYYQNTDSKIFYMASISSPKI